MHETAVGWGEPQSSNQQDYDRGRHRQKCSRGNRPIHHCRKNECAEDPKAKQERIRRFVLDDIDQSQCQNRNSNGDKECSLN